MFSLEAVMAKKGDCLILSYGERRAPKHILIDGGDAGVYRRYLRKRLIALKRDQGGDGPLEFELGMVSHVDQDHIKGILDLTDEMLREPASRRLVSFRSFWHNSFDGIVNNAGEVSRSARGHGAVSASIDALAASLAASADERGRLIAASINQGRRLHDNLISLSLQGNRPFDGLVTAPNTVNAEGGVALRLIGPLKHRLDDLQEEWKKVSSAAMAAALLDDSVPNLSSLMLLVEYRGKRMLLTGDGRGDDIVDGMRAAGFDLSRPLPLDILKVPHHGSNRNVTTGFFRRFPAKHYVISADGHHGNPDNETLEMIAESRRPSDVYEIVMTQRLPRLVAKLRALRRGRKFTYRFRSDNELGITVDL